MPPALAPVDFLQTTQWAEILRRGAGARSECVTLEQDGRTIAWAVITSRPPSHRGAVVGALLRRASMGSGPVVSPDQDFLAASDAISRHFLQRPRIPASISLSFQTLPLLPDFTGQVALDAIQCSRQRISPLIDRAISTRFTRLVDLGPGVENLLELSSRSVRRGLSSARKAGVSVRKIESQEDFARVFEPAFLRLRGIRGRNTGLAEAWTVHGFSTRYSFFVAESQSGEVLGTLGYYQWANRATEILSSVIRRQGLHGVQESLHVTAMEYASSSGARYFDLAGVSPSYSAERTSRGVSDFKAKFFGMDARQCEIRYRLTGT